VQDGFIMLVIVTAGVILPALSFYNLWYTATYGFNVYMWFAYHVYRVGPMAMHFAIVNTLAHKEGHTYTGMFKKPCVKIGIPPPSPCPRSFHAARWLCVCVCVCVCLSVGLCLSACPSFVDACVA